MSTIINDILQMRKLSHREVKLPVTSRTRQSWDSNLGHMASQPMHITTVL